VNSPEPIPGKTLTIPDSCTFKVYIDVAGSTCPANGLLKRWKIIPPVGACSEKVYSDARAERSTLYTCKYYEEPI
jgi:hypothetical protein